MIPSIFRTEVRHLKYELGQTHADLWRVRNAYFAALEELVGVMETIRDDDLSSDDKVDAIKEIGERIFHAAVRS